MRAAVSPLSHGRRGGGCRSSTPARRSGGPRTHRPGSPQAGGAHHSWHWVAGHPTPLSGLLGMDRRALRARRLSGVGTGSMTAVVPPPVGDRPRRRRPRVLRVVGARGPSRRPRRGPGSSARFPCSRSCRSGSTRGHPRVTAARLDVGATGLGQRADGSIRLLTRSQIMGYLHGALSNCGRRHATAAKSPMRRGGVLSRLDRDALPRVEKERVADVFVDPYPAPSQR